MRRILACLSISLTLLLGTGTGFAKTINIFSGVSPVFAPIFVADMQGYFKKQGLEVNVRPFTSGAAATEGFRSGGAQFLVAGDVPMIYLLAGGDATLLTQFSSNAGMMIVVGNKKVTNPAQLKGKKIGLVRKSAAEYLLHNYLKSGNLTLQDVKLVSLAPFDQIPALVQGQLDALSTWKPFETKVFALSHDFKVLTESGKVGYTLYSGIVGRKDFLTKQNRPQVEAMMRALRQATKWLSDNDVNTVSKALAGYLKTNAADMADVVKDNHWDMVDDAAFRQSMAQISAFLYKKGFLPNDVDWAHAIDPSYLKALDPSLVKG